MKKHISAVLLIVLLLTINSPMIFADQRYGHHYFEYYVRDSGVEICGYLGNEEIVDVPKFIAGLPVYAIVEGAFSNCPTVKQINLPETVMVIEEGAISSSISVAFLGKAYGEQEKDEGTSDASETAGEMVEDPSDTGSLPVDNTPVGENEIRTDGAEETDNDLTPGKKDDLNPENEGREEPQQAREETNKEDITVQEEEKEQEAKEKGRIGKVAFCVILIVLLAVGWIILLKRRKR